MFTNEKKVALSKLDKSKKGSIDSGVKGLVDLINSKEEYYTTSSCSGRVVLWQNGGKNEGKWLKVSHDLIEKVFFDVSSQELVWLRVDPFIIHIACRDLDTANVLLDKAKLIFKKSCLLDFRKKFVVEIMASERMEMPFYSGKVLFNDLDMLLELVNGKLRRNKERIGEFVKVF
jgi:tRNA wybutosine-synthesizing protein 3